MTAPTAAAIADRAHLAARVRARRQLVEDLRGVLDNLVEFGRDLAHADELERAAERMRPVFAREFATLDTGVSRLEAKAAGESATDAWQCEADLVQTTDAFLEELLDFVEGSLARAVGLDRRVCSIVDDLLNSLAKDLTISWERTTIPAVREETSNRTWIIALSIADATIWSVPYMVHELGHFAAERIEDRNGQRLGIPLIRCDWLDEQVGAAAGTDVPSARRFFADPRAHEFFADVFAAYAIGPAYAAALAWAGTPHRPWEAEGDHPGWGFRLRATLRTLGAEWSDLSGLIEESWQRDLQAAGVAGTAPAANLALVDAFVSRSLEVLRLTAPDLRYDDSAAVLDVEEMLSDKAVDGPADVRAIVNGAWSWRIRQGWNADAGAVGDTALRWALAARRNVAHEH